MSGLTMPRAHTGLVINELGLHERKKGGHPSRTGVAGRLQSVARPFGRRCRGCGWFRGYTKPPSLKASGRRGPARGGWGCEKTCRFFSQPRAVPRRLLARWDGCGLWAMGRPCGSFVPPCFLSTSASSHLFVCRLPAQSSSPQPVYVKSEGDVDDFDHLLRIEPEFDGPTRRTEGRKRQRRVSGRWAASPHRHTRCAHYLTSDVTKCSKSACKTPVKMT